MMKVARTLRGLALLCASLGAVGCRSATGDVDVQETVEAEREIGDAVVVLQDLDGRPLAGVSVWFKAADVDDYMGGDEFVTGADGVARARDTYSHSRRGSENGYDIVAFRRGYRSVDLENFEGVATLRLPPSSPVRIRVRIAADSVLPEPPRRMVIHLDWIRADGDADPRKLLPLPPEERSSPNVLEFEVDDPGTYVLWVEESVRSSELWPDVPIRDALMTRDVHTEPKAPAVTVEYGQSPKEIEIRVDAARRKPEDD
jgi:hypothetical protein